MNYADSPDIALAWLNTLDGLPADDTGNVLPGDPTLWATQGFVQVPMVVGGSPDVHLPMREPIVEINAWTNRPGTEEPPWRRAGHLANWIIRRMHAQRTPLDLDLGGDYYPVRLHAVWAASEPRRITGDPSGYARVMFEAQMRWVVLDG